MKDEKEKSLASDLSLILHPSSIPGSSPFVALRTSSVRWSALQIGREWRTQKTRQRLATVVVNTTTARHRPDTGHWLAAIIVRTAMARERTDWRHRLTNIIIRTTADRRTRPRPPVLPEVARRTSGRIGGDVANACQAKQNTDATSHSHARTPWPNGRCRCRVFVRFHSPQR